MAYLVEFIKCLNNQDFQGFLSLWEEYCQSDEIDTVEYNAILKAIINSSMAKQFDKCFDSALEMWQKITDEEENFEIFKTLSDLQTSNDPKLADLTYQILQKRFGNQEGFEDKIKMVGLKNRQNFQGAVAHFEMLCHMKKGNFVYHKGGWGTGEIIDISFIREQLTLEFENVTGKRDLSFASAFKNLIPIKNTHFLAKRFGNPDALEKDAKKDPVAVIKMLLKDLGPKTAQEIKDELSELVIPEPEWTKWWQNARGKLKKDTMIQSPVTLKAPFVLRNKELSHDDRVLADIQNEANEEKAIEIIYSCLRDHPELLKNAQTKEVMQERLLKGLNEPSISKAQMIESYILLSEMGQNNYLDKLKQLIKNDAHLGNIIKDMAIGAFKKRVLLIAKEIRSDWSELFLELLFSLPIHTLREYIVKELNQGIHQDALSLKIENLLNNPAKQPELFVWYFQKCLEDHSIPFSDKEGLTQFLESFLLLLSQIENLQTYRDLVKKMHLLINENRFVNIRRIIEKTSIEYLKEFLLLVTKCGSITDHDKKIMQSLAQVVHPSLGKKEKDNEEVEDIIWSTKEGYQKVQARIQQIGTQEIVENAREIEAARALGDLRENSEYKFALEKRSRLQSELQFLTRQLNKARIILPTDIPKNEVGAGSIVTIQNSKGVLSSFTLLGPWDADPDNNILSLQSKFAQSMLGHKKGDSFKFQDEEYTIIEITSFMEK